MSVLQRFLHAKIEIKSVFYRKWCVAIVTATSIHIYKERIHSILSVLVFCAFGVLFTILLYIRLQCSGVETQYG